MKITSPAFEQGQSIPSKYTCDGENINPPFTITDILERTKSLVLVSNDPDAPSGNWIHWLVWNIAPDADIIAENSVPAGATEGTNSFGKTGYGGPCPPAGEHRYFFKIYALDTMIDLDSSADVSQLEAAMEGHVLEQAEVMGVYSRSQ